MSTSDVFFYPMCPSFILSCPVGFRFTIRCVICFLLSCPFVMCSFIICVLSYFICLVHSDCFLHSMCNMLHDVMSTRKVFFILCVLCLFSLVDSEYFLPSDLSYAIYCRVHLWCVLSCYGPWVLFHLVQSDRVPSCGVSYVVLSILKKNN